MGTLLIVGPGIAVLAVAGAAHVLWALGSGAPGATVPQRGGKPLFRPGRGLTLLVALALFTAAALLAAGAGLWAPPLPNFIVSAGCWLLALVCAARAIGDFRHVGFFKRNREGAFARADTRYYSPLCAYLALAAGFAAG